MAGRAPAAVSALQRQPEPRELMDEPEQARAYAEADFSEANALFLSLLGRLHPGPLDGPVLDLGCGPADIPLRLARRHPGIRVDAVDGAPAMLALAREAVAAAGLEERVRLHRCRLPHDPLPGGPYRVLLSNSLLHHLSDPADLWRLLPRQAAADALVLVMDLARPASAAAAEQLVKRYAADAPPVLRRDFHASLLAAYTPEEVEAQLRRAGLGGLRVSMVSDRHLAVEGRLP